MRFEFSVPVPGVPGRDSPAAGGLFVLAADGASGPLAGDWKLLALDRMAVIQAEVAVIKADLARNPLDLRSEAAPGPAPDAEYASLSAQLGGDQPSCEPGSGYGTRSRRPNRWWLRPAPPNCTVLDRHVHQQPRRSRFPRPGRRW